MAQKTWQVKPQNTQRPYEVGVYHGERSGHLVIYINSKIFKIDFFVKDNQMYSFMLDGELCELYIIKTANGFEYDLQFNFESPTELNQERKRLLEMLAPESHSIPWIGGIAALAFILLVLGTVYLVNRSSISFDDSSIYWPTTTGKVFYTLEEDNEQKQHI